jgi:hypothetical protein
MTPDVPATPDTPQPKRLGSEAWIQMIVLGLVFSLIAFIVVLVVVGSAVWIIGLVDFRVLAVVAFAIGTLIAGRIVGWYGTLRWIAAFCLNALIWSAIAYACVFSKPPGNFA